MLIYNKYIIKLLLLIILVIITSCSNNTSPYNINISGQIILLNNQIEVSHTEYDSIFVALYPVSILNSDIDNIIESYPDIGTEFSQQILFDHRNQNPVYCVKSDLNGFFNINNVKKGIYNIVILKSNWSIKYIYNVEIEESSKQDIGTIFLNKAINIKSNINTQYIFKSGQLYLVEDDTNFLNDVIVEEGTFIAVKPNKTIKFYNNISTPLTGWWHVNTDYNIFKIEKINISSDNYYNGIVIYGDNINLLRSSIQNSNTALSINSNNCSISYCNFENNGYGIITSNIDLNVDNCYFYNNFAAGIQFFGLNNNLNISDCIFNNCNDGAVIYSGGESIIGNNYFINNNTAIKPTSSHGKIHNCEFKNNYYDIFMLSSNYIIEYNNFVYSRYISIIPNSISLTSQSIISNNNFIDTHFAFISVRAGAPLYTCVIENLNATYNFWNKIDIDQYLLDSSDNIDYPGQICPWSIIYMPKYQYKIASAGIH